MKQLTLFPSPKPLVQRFGPDFFRSAPRSAGVYIMTGESGRVLYIGQSKNLRARLGAYKNARPDCAPRKMIRLVHEVRSIVWEKCDSAEAAKSRESELLRVHRPKFNVAGTWPAPERYFRVRLYGGELELDCFPDRGDSDALNERAPGERLFGPFKASAFASYGALLRLLWALSHQVCSPSDYPAGFFSAKPPRPARFSFGPNDSANDPQEGPVIFCALCDFLHAGSQKLISLLESRILPDPVGTEASGNHAKANAACHPALLALDFESLQSFSRILQSR